MHFQRQDMENSHYNWESQGDKSVFTGQPSRRVFDRFNGNQVLFLINYYGSLADKFTVQEGKNIEQMIFNDLPMNVLSEISVLNWIKTTALAVK